MPKAIFNGVVVAESDHCESVEGNTYFPHNSLNKAYFKPSDHTTVCGWKGTANYYDLLVNGKHQENVAWYYPKTSEAAKNIENYVAFYPSVTVENS